MTRPEFFEPEVLSTAVVVDALGQAGVAADKDIVGQWTRFEMLIAYDWAMRELLVASDNLVRRRDMPWIVMTAGSSPLVTALRTAEMSLHECTRRILAQAPDGLTTKNLLLRLSEAGYRQLNTKVLNRILDEDDDIGMSDEYHARWLWAPMAEVTP